MSEKNKEASPPISGRPATPDEEAWHQFRRQSEQETPKRLEEAAKYLSGIISIVLTILTTRDPAVFQHNAHSNSVAVASGFLLLALLATLFVLFPKRWQQLSQSAQDIERVHRASVQYKYRLLLAAAVFFSLALLLLTWVFARHG